MISYQQIVNVVLILGGITLVGLLTYVLVELLLVLKSIRRIMERLELLSDIKGWMSFFRKMPKRKATS